jgi:hypothetical protein
LTGKLTVDLLVRYQHLNFSELPRASEGNLADLAVISEEENLSGMLHDQFLCVSFARIGGRKPFFDSQPDRPHEGFIQVYLIQGKTSERTDQGLAEPAEFATDQYHPRPLSGQFNGGAQGIGNQGEVRAVSHQPRQFQDRASAVEKYRIVRLDKLERRLSDSLLFSGRN